MIDISLSDAIYQILCLEWWLIFLCQMQLIKSFVWSDDWYFFVRCNLSNPVFGVMIDISLSDAINQILCLEWWLIFLSQMQLIKSCVRSDDWYLYVRTINQILCLEWYEFCKENIFKWLRVLSHSQIGWTTAKVYPWQWRNWPVSQG